tara:strand:- start:12 stop:404 length:393 start_codon:yes stop_codon:yes gene_type:complete
MRKRRNLFLISLSIALIYIVLSLRGADAGNNVLVIIGLFGFFSLFTTPILFLSILVNNRDDLPNIVKSILPETKSTEVNTKASNRLEANKVVTNNQSDQRMKNRNNDQKRNRGNRGNRGNRRKLSTRKNS